MNLHIRKSASVGMTTVLKNVSTGMASRKGLAGLLAYDMNMPLTAEELWFQRHLQNPSRGRLPRNVASKAIARMKRREWVRGDDGVYRFLSPA